MMPVEYNVNYYIKKEQSISDSSLKVFYNIFFFLILFPYVSFGLPAVSDAQPWAVIFAIPLLLFNVIEKKQIPKILWIFWFLTLVSIVNFSLFFIFEGGTLVAYMRSVFKYLSFAIILPTSFFALKYLSFKYYGFAVFLWFLVANLQLITKSPLFVEYIVSNVRYNVGRGSYVLGFASEPAYLGRMGIVFIMINEFLGLRNPQNGFFRFVLFSISLEMIIISFSITGYVLLFVYLFVKLLFLLIDKRKRILKIFAATSFIFMGIILYYFLDPQFFYKFGRVGNFILKGMEHGFMNSLLEDHSFQTAISEIKLVFQGFRFLGNGIPEGRSASIASIFSMSYDVGIYGVLLMVVIIVIFFKGIKKSDSSNERFFLINLFIMFFLMVMVDTVSLPYLPFLLAIPLVLSKN